MFLPPRRVLTSMAVLVAAILPSGRAGAAEPGSGIQRVAWLQGCWTMAAADRTVDEQWMAPRGASMVGVARTVRGGEMVDYELTVIRAKGDQLAYEAHPSGQPSATFLSESVGKGAVVFQNLAHDFPKRIGYERRGKDRVLAWIDGGPDSERPRIEYPYTRVACDARARAK